MEEPEAKKQEARKTEEVNKQPIMQGAKTLIVNSRLLLIVFIFMLVLTGEPGLPQEPVRPLPVHLVLVFDHSESMSRGFPNEALPRVAHGFVRYLQLYPSEIQATARSIVFAGNAVEVTGKRWVSPEEAYQAFKEQTASPSVMMTKIGTGTNFHAAFQQAVAAVQDDHSQCAIVMFSDFIIESLADQFPESDKLFDDIRSSLGQTPSRCKLVLVVLGKDITAGEKWQDLTDPDLYQRFENTVDYRNLPKDVEALVKLLSVTNKHKTVYPNPETNDNQTKSASFDVYGYYSNLIITVQKLQQNVQIAISPGDSSNITQHVGEQDFDEGILIEDPLPGSWQLKTTADSWIRVTVQPRGNIEDLQIQDSGITIHDDFFWQPNTVVIGLSATIAVWVASNSRNLLPADVTVEVKNPLLGKPVSMNLVGDRFVTVLSQTDTRKFASNQKYELMITACPRSHIIQCENHLKTFYAISNPYTYPYVERLAPADVGNKLEIEAAIANYSKITSLTKLSICVSELGTENHSSRDSTVTVNLTPKALQTPPYQYYTAAAIPIQFWKRYGIRVCEFEGISVEGTPFYSATSSVATIKYPNGWQRLSNALYDFWVSWGLFLILIVIVVLMLFFARLSTYYRKRSTLED